MKLGRGIVDLLESLGLSGFPLFAAAVGVSIVILYVSYLIATQGLHQKKSEKK